MNQDALIDVVNVIADGGIPEATLLAFEYIRATCAEVGWPIPAEPVDLPDPLRGEVEDLARAYLDPCAFFVAYRLRRPIGCVGLQVQRKRNG
jgi:hypothetical protein